MKRSMTTALTLAIAALTAPAFAQSATTKCKAGEVQVLRYDFTVGYAGNEVIDRHESPRLAESGCVAGILGETTFRGVTTEFKNKEDIHTGILAAEMFANIGLTDAKAIKQLVDRVVGLKAAEAARPKPKAEPTLKSSATSGNDAFTGIFGPEPKKK